jgi:antitoxin (DNA-binding transcriptional repressor) of toxin-antitoxin stability system
MPVLSVRELNTNISRALARVEAGETLDISRNGKIVAELRPKSRQATAEWRKAYKGSVAALRKGLPAAIEEIGEEDKYGDASL